MSGIAHQHEVVLDPGAVGDAREVDPDPPAAQVVGQQAVAAQHVGEQALAEGDALVVAHALEARLAPDRLRRLDDEGRGGLVEAVGVGLEPAPLGLLEDEGEGLEPAVGAEPDVAAMAAIDLGLEVAGVAAADSAVDAVGGDDEIGRGQLFQRLDLGLEQQADAERLGPVLQDAEQPLACDAAEAVTRRA